MNRLASVAIVLTASLILISTGHATAQTFDRFLGDYTANGHVRVSDGSGLAGSGKTKVYIHPTSKGRFARVILRGTVKVSGAARPFSATIVLGKANSAAVSNLAPGIDDGHTAKLGTYTVGTSQIVVTIPFVFGTTEGEASYAITKRGRKIKVVETLKTTALPTPVTWRFSGAIRR